MKWIELNEKKYLAKKKKKRKKSGYGVVSFPMRYAADTGFADLKPGRVLFWPPHRRSSGAEGDYLS